MTDSKILIDSSAWLAHFGDTDNGQIEAIVKSQITIYTSVITLFEIKRKLLKEKVTKESLIESLNNIIERSIIVDIDNAICLLAAEHAVAHNLAAVDALIYATTKLNSCTLVTFDNNFRNLENVKVLK